MALEFRDGDDLVIQADLPGLDPDGDLEIWLSHDVLHIRARTETGPLEGHVSDLRYGTFVRDIAMPVGTDEDQVRAAYAGGRLEVRVPLAGDRRVAWRRIPVTRAFVPFEPGTSRIPPGPRRAVTS